METVPPDVFCECEPMTRTTYTMPVHNGATWEVCERCGAFVEQNPPASRDGGDAKGNNEGGSRE